MSPETPSPLPTLVLVCKRPALGHGKQRLAAAFGRVTALAIAERLLDCALEDLAAWPGPRIIAPDHARHGDWAAARAGFAACRAQSPGNLGERLQALDRRLRAEGHQALLYIGSDAPTLAAPDYRTAARLLETRDGVLLPARDGGVVLLGSCRPWPALAALPWSSERLCQALADACHAAGYRLGQGAEHFDVDRPHDVRALRLALRGDPRPARRRLLQTVQHLDLEEPCPAHWHSA